MNRAPLAAALIGLAATTLACTGPRLPPLSAGDDRLHPWEEALWRAAAGRERALERSGSLLRNEEVEDYLRGVERRLLPADWPPTLRRSVLVVDGAEGQAFAFPDGAIYVTVALLADLENEAQLAALIGHELSHALLRHTFRKRQASLGNAAIAVGTLGLGTVPAVAAQAGYSRDLEREADEHGMELVSRAGYDVAEAAKVLERLELLSREEGGTESSWLGSHPDQAERIATARESAKRPGGRGADVGAERYRAAIRPLLLRAARRAFAAGQLERSERVARTFVAGGPSGAAKWSFLGDVSRLGEGNVDEAIQRYRAALVLDDGHAEAHRGLGRALLRAGKADEARTELRRYLELRPGAYDRALVEGDLRLAEARP